MKRTDVTYGQLDKVLRLLGFSCRPSKQPPPGRVYEHKESGAIIILPTFDQSERVYKHHLVYVRTELDNFGLADPLGLRRQAPEGGMTRVSEYVAVEVSLWRAARRQYAGGGVKATLRR